MSLASGVRLGAYEIIALIGSGGMGEVYRARDPRLERDVAVKVLPAALAGDAERLRRFEQEARAAAALNHPNILAVHDVGGAESGVPYVVSELLDGATLRERLHGGPLPMRKAIDFAVQIAHGLAAAHGKGIVHRDLKPENVFVTEDSRVKILDFGLAKLIEREPALSGVSALPTVPPDTIPGLVVGTIGYMAPEQVRGRAADHRADIFAFGTVLYEMLSGQRAFRGDTAADTMTAILKEDPPDLPSADRHMPPALARIVDRCLEKAPAARFQSADDLAFALESLTSASGAFEATASAAAPLVPVRRWRVAAGVTLGMAVAAAAGYGSALLRRPAPVDERPVTFALGPPDGWNLALTGRTNAVSLAPIAISPDGRYIAFIASNRENKNVIWVRSLDSIAARELSGTDDAVSPFWSPDGRAVGFFTADKLKKVDVTGGAPVTIAAVGNATDGTWGRDGVILYGIISTAVTPLMKVSASGGTPAEATTLQKGDTKHVRPRFLPDGRHFLYRLLGGTVRGRIVVGSLDSPDRKDLLEADSTNVAYSRGHVLFLREATLMAQPFDERTQTLSGAPFPIAEPIQTVPSASTAFGMFAASDDGVLAYQTGESNVLPQLTWFDRSGTAVAAVAERARYNDVALAPDGKRATVSLVDPAQSTLDIWTVDLARGLRSRFTFDPSDDATAVWSPDGKRLAFNSRRKGHFDLYVKASNGSGEEEALLVDAADKTPLSWSRDDRFLLYGSISGETGPDIWVLPLTGDKKPYPVLNSKFAEGAARFSPDGRWIAYMSNESGTNQVYVVAFPGPGGKWQVSASGGITPRWQADGRAIFYRETTGVRLMAAAVQALPSGFEVREVTPLFPAVPSGNRAYYDVSPDGRFLVNTALVQTGATPRPLTVVTNWPAVVKK
jgi:Tol biopolymer transport system component